MDVDVSARTWWKRLWCGTWTKNRLLSRKWGLVAVTAAVAIAASLVGREIGSETLKYLGIIVPAYLLVEGALDWRHMRKQRNEEDEDDE